MDMLKFIISVVVSIKKRITVSVWRCRQLKRMPLTKMLKAGQQHICYFFLSHQTTEIPGQIIKSWETENERPDIIICWSDILASRCHNKWVEQLLQNVLINYYRPNVGLRERLEASRMQTLESNTGFRTFLQKFHQPTTECIRESPD